VGKVDVQTFSKALLVKVLKVVYVVLFGIRKDYPHVHRIAMLI